MNSIKKELPVSVTTEWINLTGAAVLFVAMVWLSVYPVSSPVFGALVLIFAYATPVAILEVFIAKSHIRQSSGLVGQRIHGFDLKRTLTKFVGLSATITAVFLCHFVFRIYPIAHLFPAFYVFVLFLPALCILAAVYIYWTDARMISPRDGYWQLGAWLTGQSKGAEVANMNSFALGWVVKGFFLPIMFYYLVLNVADIAPVQIWFSGDWVLVTRRLVFLSIIFELVVVCAGYSLTLRLFDSHIRTVNPLVWGWLVTLACYEPFNHVTFGQIANRYVGEPWYEMIQSYPIVTLPWLLGLLVSYVVWVWATCSFGLRWSNLTNRGVVTCGPYKYLKHPDYFSKSIFFWLTAMPFLADATLAEKIVATIALLTVNGLYYARARAEEVHMSEDPDYVRYALVMNEKSLLRFLGKAFPSLLYRSPK